MMPAAPKMTAPQFTLLAKMRNGERVNYATHTRVMNALVDKRWAKAIDRDGHHAPSTFADYGVITPDGIEAYRAEYARREKIRQMHVRTHDVKTGAKYRCQFCTAETYAREWKNDKCPKCGRAYDAMLAQEEDDG